MSTESLLTDAALRAWKQNIDRGNKIFAKLSEEELQQEIAPGKNRLIYLLGHLAAVNDMMLPLLGLGPRLHSELDAPYVTNPDRSTPDPVTGEQLKQIWTEVNDALWAGFTKLSPAEWVERHTSVSEEDFAKEPHRNRFSVLLSRTGHVANHLGQALLVKR